MLLDLLIILAGLFSGGSTTELPGWEKNGRLIESYEVAVKQTENQKVLNIKFTNIPANQKSDSYPSISLDQYVDATSYLGKHIRLSIEFRTQNAQRFGFGLYAYGQYQREILAFDNASYRDIKGTHDWKTQSIILRIPEKAKYLHLSIFLRGEGEAWVQELTLEEVSPALGVTDYYAGLIVQEPEEKKEWPFLDKVLPSPYNLNFEEK